jgi:flagellar motor switch protein FliN
MQPTDIAQPAEATIPGGASPLRSNADATDPAEGKAPAANAGAASDELAAGETSDGSQTPISRVIDVPLTVTLRFGQRQLTVRELLELNTGSLVELDQQVEEPVHLMLGERVIARGEVVIVDGNYGIRVLEVVEHPATQRLAALGRA